MFHTPKGNINKGVKKLNGEKRVFVSKNRMILFLFILLINNGLTFIIGSDCHMNLTKNSAKNQ
ncbi:hypothetical protein CAPN008_02920 [Capnocytophaga canis]|nr:hypothetical protein CAPN008_02920 [Capnocytophaga canis]